MKVSDYIVDFLAREGITDVFGYQGTMIAHFVDSVCKSQFVKNHCCYNEQGAAFAAVGYAKATGKTGVAYATSGPGAMNLMSGIADAYFDSVPTVFITGQINLNEYTDIPTLRQQGFQQVNIIDSVKSYTKYCTQVKDKNKIRYELEKAFYVAQEGRKGPVLLDIPMNIQREDVDVNNLSVFDAYRQGKFNIDTNNVGEVILSHIRNSEKPIILVGNGVRKNSEGHMHIEKLIHKLGIPVITSMPARHLFSHDDLYCGYLGSAYGCRAANLIACKKADLILSIGCSMCRRQTGINTEKFASNAKIIRVDIDSEELKRNVHEDDLKFCMDYRNVVQDMIMKVDFSVSHDWVAVCQKIKHIMEDFDNSYNKSMPNVFVEVISELQKDKVNIFADVGQHQIWTAQSYITNEEQQLFFSGGHGAMGYSLPAAIGSYYATRNRSIIICGDGSFQMNIQELQWVVREQIPIFMFIFNNKSLGLIRQQQGDFFNGQFFGAVEEGGYTVPSFKAISEAYGIKAFEVKTIEELKKAIESADVRKPCLFEIFIDSNIGAYPKTYFGEEMYNQRPYISAALMDALINL